MKFHKYYPPHIELDSRLFSSSLLKRTLPGKEGKDYNVDAMFYDLEDPIAFMREIHEVLADDGVWVFEQSYMPTMLEMNSYDTV